MSEATHLLGPVLIAVILNVLFYGVCVMQFITYYNSSFNDRRPIRMLVNWVLFLDTVHSSASVYLLWNFAVDNYGIRRVLFTAPWPFSYTPLMTSLASCPIQAFMAWRIHQFAKSWKLFIGLLFFSFAQLSTGIAASVGALELLSIVHFSTLVPIVDSWLVTSIFCDATITTILWYYLSKSRTGFKQTDHVITRLIRSSVETAAFGSIFCLMDLVCFTVLPGTNYHAIFAFPLGRIYTVTLLLTLNSRNSLRSEMNNNVYTASQTPWPVFARPQMAVTGSEVIRSLQRSHPMIGSPRPINQTSENIMKSTLEDAEASSSTSEKCTQEGSIGP